MSPKGEDALHGGLLMGDDLEKHIQGAQDKMTMIQKVHCCINDIKVQNNVICETKVFISKAQRCLHIIKNYYG